MPPEIVSRAIQIAEAVRVPGTIAALSLSCNLEGCGCD
jgi:hypothetical protein